MIVEFFLKLRSDFKAKNYSSTQANGRLRYEGRIESLTHVFMKHMKVTEKSLVAIIWSLEIVMCVFVIVVDSLIL
jgi:hypothetical protein